MKTILLSMLLQVFLVAASSAAESSVPTEPVAVADQIAKLNTLLIPPDGTDKADIDLVFGKPKEIKELKGKGSPVDYPMHIYELLPPIGKEEFRAFLYVTYRQGKVWRAGINHLCVTKNRYAGVIDDSKQKQEIERENQQALVNLQDIRNRFAEKLKAASWNKASEQDGGGQPATRPESK